MEDNASRNMHRKFFMSEPY